MDRAVPSAVLHTRSRHAGTLSLLLLAWLAALPAYADDDEAKADTSGKTLGERALTTLWGNANHPAALHAALTVDVSPVAVPPSTRLTNAPANATSASVVDYRAWVGTGRASLGIGVTAAAYREVQPGLNGSATSGPLLGASSAPMLGLGLRYQMSRNSQLTFDSLASGRGDDISPQMRVGMEFRSAPSQVLGIARGTFLRAQLSSSSQVSLNWRGGKVALLLRSQF